MIGLTKARIILEFDGFCTFPIFFPKYRLCFPETNSGIFKLGEFPFIHLSSDSGAGTQLIWGPIRPSISPQAERLLAEEARTAEGRCSGLRDEMHIQAAGGIGDWPTNPWVESGEKKWWNGRTNNQPHILCYWYE